MNAHDQNAWALGGHGGAVLTPAEVDAVLDAVDELANALAYGADQEKRPGLMQRATILSELADRIRDRAGIQVDRP